MQTIWQDLRYGLRGLANRPSFTLLAILNLGLGIGAATTIFSVIQNVLLDPFPYTDAHRVAAIQIHDTTTSRPGGRSFFQVPEFLDYQTQNHVFDDVIGGTNEVWAVDRGVAITLTGTLNGYLTQFSYATPRFSLVLLGVFASVGLLLVAIGVYSVIAYTVSQQTHEIGIRMALGAAPVHVLRMVGLMGVRLVALGTVIGLLASVAASRVIAAQLWGTSQNDPLTLGIVVAVIALVGLTACYVPARRATKVDPLIALRG